MQLSNIKATYNPAADNECFILKQILRPVSFYLTWVLLAVGIRNPNIVNLLSLASGLSALMLLEASYYYYGVGLYILYLILDQCDGNMARVTQSTSYQGKFFDGAIDVLIDGLLPFAVLNNLFGVFLSIMFIYTMFLLNRFSFFSP